MEEGVVLRNAEEESVAEAQISGITLENFLWLFEGVTLYSKVYGPIFQVVLVLLSAVLPTNTLRLTFLDCFSMSVLVHTKYYILVNSLLIANCKICH